MSSVAYERAIAEQAGEPVPSFVKLRRFKGANGYPTALGYYSRRYTFRPLPGQELAEAIAVRPDEIEDHR